ncbi:nose resistant to fluoxetine protein 6-like [Rhopalosiphum maidis]|uniref:nose resistant to fluoxetine protein 6-like n=1 Tax=Rhopalosiphum maidis TaxID=43146 RepID=UPI000EFDE080|nr:nose resistant to fluoxetine protein 6-like [Rhopalosiphum maidis]XP_026815123.1 nose resistant to fluoxetine protein 6-like [Rhopalosiphum maidis]
MSITISVVLLAILLAIRSSDGQFEPAAAVADGLPGPWISELFYQALANFTVRNVGSSACRIQSDLYDRHLRNHTSWAVRMAESWNRYPTGILAGNTYHMGNYDECVDVRYPVIGQYCLSEIKLIPPTGRDYNFNRTEDLDDFGNKNAWKTVLGWGNYPDQVQRNSLNLGICIPNSCSALDLQISLQNKLDAVFAPEEFKTVVRVDPILCTVKGDMYPHDTPFYLTSTLFLLIFLICCGTTFYHFIRILNCTNSKETSEGLNSFCKIFSFIESIKALLKYDKDNELNVIYGFKVLTMLAVLLGHRLFYLLGNPMSNPKLVESIYLSGPNIILTSTNLVDPFFFMSGVLMQLTCYKSYQKVKSGSILKKITSPIIHRVSKMLPAYCAMMAITAHIVPHLGDGPLWPQKTWNEAEICKNYWWTNLLFISNLVDIKYECLIVSWYVLCDVQFFIIGVIILYVYTKNTKYGIGLLGTILGLSITIPFLVTILSKIDGIDKMQLPFLENLRIFISLNKSYRLSYMRATPFFCGLATGFIVDKLRKNKFKFSQMTVYSGTFVVFMICICVQLYGARFYTRQIPYYPLEHALYSIVSHCTWTVPSIWVAVCHFTSGYGPLTILFNNKLTVILGRLSYSVFLVNLTVMMMSQSSQRLPVYFSTKSVIDAWIYDTVKSYLMGLALHLVVEVPFAKLIKPWI